MSPKTRIEKPEHQGQTDAKEFADHFLVSGTAYRMLHGTEHDYDDEAQPFVMLVSPVNPDPDEDRKQQVTLADWLREHKLKPAAMDPDFQAMARSHHGTHLQLFKARDLSKLQKLRDTPYVSQDMFENSELPRKLSEWFAIPLKDFDRGKGINT